MKRSNGLQLEPDQEIGKENKKWMQFFIFALFFFSGISGLIYQIIWTRMLTLIFGNTMLATSTVLTAYMAGLAFGSFAAGKYIDRKPRPLVKIYAALEAGIGVFALIFPILLKAFGSFYANLYQGLEGNILALNLTRFVICFVLILIPTFFMGATLPVLLKRFVRGAGSIGHEFGFLYGLNTAGAVAGSLACGFLLLMILGMQATTRIGVAINLAVAVAAWFIGKGDKKGNSPETIPGSVTERSISKREYSAATTVLVLIGIGLSGFCALAYEVLWTRMLNLFFHNTVHSFTTILATFLSGIAIGSFIYSKFLSRIIHKILLFVILEASIGVMAYSTPFIFTSLYDLLFSRPAEVLAVLKAGVIMILPTILMGIALPLSVQICQRGPQREGNSVGTVYAVNTLGSIFGSFAAGFILVPYLGIHKSVIVVAGLNMLAGVLALFTLVRPRTRWGFAAAFAATISILFLGASAPIFRNLYQKNQPYTEILSYKEGKIANVVVYDFYKDGYKDLYLNSIEEASSRLWHVQLFKMLGILPTIIHHQPDDALMIAFGAGMSAGACAQQVKSMECAELNPDIHQVAKIFSHENLDVINNPSFKLIVNDGRNQVLLSPHKYSLIISDATNPLTFDSWPLYTKEFYETCRKQLKPGGVFCQWVPIPLPDDAIKIILKTFKTVFPHTSFWCIYGSSQCLMLGTPERLHIDYQELSRRLSPIYKSSGLAEYGVDSEGKFLSFFLCGEDKLDEMLRGFDKINTDDLPQAHFNSTLNKAGIQTSLDMLEYQESIFPYLANMGDRENQVKKTLEDYVVLAQLLSRGFLLSNQLEYEKASLFAAEKNLKDDKNVACMLQYDPVRKAHFLDRLARNPQEASAHYNLGLIASKEADYAKAIEEFKYAIALKPDFARAHLELAYAYIDSAMFDLAVEKLLEIRELNAAGAVLFTVENKLKIIRVLRAQTYQPKNPVVCFALGRAYLDNGEFSKSAEAFETALQLQPNDPQTLKALAVIYENLELLDKAVDTYRKLAEVVPGDQAIKQKISELSSIQTDPAARVQWLSTKMFFKEKQDTHPAGCVRANKKWAFYEYDGKISSADLLDVAQTFEKVTLEHPDHMHAYIDAAKIYEYLGQYRRASTVLDRGLKIAPENNKVAADVKRLLLLDKLKSSNLSRPEKVEIYNNIGFLYWGSGEFEQGADYFKKALELDPQNPTAMSNLGVAYSDCGKYKDAIIALERAVELNPNIKFRDMIDNRLRLLHLRVDKQ